MTEERAGAPRIVIHGAGRMGQQVAEQAQTQGLDVIAMVSRHHPGALPDVHWQPGLEGLERTPDLLVDFSLPAGTSSAARWCVQHRVPLLSGTTGLDSTQNDRLNKASEQIAVLHAANFSPGLNALLGALAHIGQWLPEIESATITDIHHVDKKDAPSGTALALAQVLEPLQSAFESQREGSVVGKHVVNLQLPGEHLSLAHTATNRSVFARGALQAGRWLVRQPPGRYSALFLLTGKQV